MTEYERALHVIFTAGAEKRRRVRDAASAALDAAYERCGLLGSGLIGRWWLCRHRSLALS